MKNPYQHAEGKPHYLDRELVRTQCFDAFNIIAASQSHAGAFEAGDDEQGELTTLFKLHHDLAEPRLSQLLLAIALFVRTFDDTFRESHHVEAYRAHSEATDAPDFIGAVDGNPLPLREACNKIIHATDFRPVYNHAGRVISGEERPVWYMTGEIELEGRLREEVWQATLHAEGFLEVVLDRITFGEAAAWAANP